MKQGLSGVYSNSSGSRFRTDLLLHPKGPYEELLNDESINHVSNQ